MTHIACRWNWRRRHADSTTCGRTDKEITFFLLVGSFLQAEQGLLTPGTVLLLFKTRVDRPELVHLELLERPQGGCLAVRLRQRLPSGRRIVRLLTSILRLLYSHVLGLSSTSQLTLAEAKVTQLLRLLRVLMLGVVGNLPFDLLAHLAALAKLHDRHRLATMRSLVLNVSIDIIDLF